MWALKIAGIFLLACFFFLALILTVRIFTETTSKPQNITLSNLSDSRATLTWYTEKPVKGSILISESPTFSLNTFFSKNMHPDNRDRGLSRSSYINHFVTIGDLSENKKYYFRIYEGVYSQFQGSFTTGPRLEPTKLKWEARGQILQSEGKTPAPYEIVYYQLVNKQGNSATLTTMTNSRGLYKFEVSGLRSRDNQSYYPFLKSEEVIYTKNEGKVNAIATDNYLLLKSRKDLIVK